MKNIVYKVETIGDLHEIAGLAKPNHPLFTIIDYSKVNVANAPESGSFVCGFYAVNFKKYCRLIYGRQYFDHQDGTLHCTAPEQVITFNRENEEDSSEGWGLYFHPELIRNTCLGKRISEYHFFSYQENEALHLSELEKQTLLILLKQMEIECTANSDIYSHDLIVSNIELLLNYCKRFYGRQFVTRTNHNQDLLVDFENFMNEHYATGKLMTVGIPSVKDCAEAMNFSPNYFNDLLKSKTGKSALDHIHYFLLEKAKNLLISSNKKIDEVAYELGFKYPQNFSKLFKNKVGVSPMNYRNNY